MNQENSKKNVFKIVAIIAVVVVILLLVINFSKNKGSDASRYESIMKSKGFTVEEVNSSEEVVTKSYNAINSSKNYTSGMNEMKSEDYASALYSELFIGFYNKLSDDSSLAPETNKSDNTYTIESDNYYCILSVSGKNVCYILVPIGDKSVAEEIMNELGY